MPIDPTETIRRSLVAEINLEPGSRAALEAQHGQVWDTDAMQANFEAIGFLAPFLLVRCRADGVRGTLMFQHRPRFYWGFSPA